MATKIVGQNLVNYTESTPTKTRNGAVVQTGTSAYTAPTTITTADLQPTTPITIPETKPQTAAAASSGYATSYLDSAKLTSDKLAEAQKASTQSQSDYASALNEALGIYGQRNTLNEQYKLDEKTQNVNKLYSEYQALERSKQNELAAIDETTTPISATKNSQYKAEIERQYSHKLADKALEYSVMNNDLTSTQTLIDNKIKTDLEPITLKLNYFKDFADKNAEKLTTAENNQLQILIKQEETAQEEKNKIGDLAKTVAGNGAPASVISSVTNAENYNDAITAAGIYTTDPLDRQYKQAQIAKLNIEAQQALKTLPSSVQTRVQGIASQFDGEQAVKNYQTSAEAIDAMKNAATTPTDDISRIYAFAKVMDPNSVVREGEYSTVQEYSTALLERTGLKAKRVFDNSGFLTDEARTFMLNTLENRLASSKKAYDNIYKSYGERINKVTGNTDGLDYITDYSAAFKDTNTDNSTQTTDTTVSSSNTTISGLTATGSWGTLTFPSLEALNEFKKDYNIQ